MTTQVAETERTPALYELTDHFATIADLLHDMGEEPLPGATDDEVAGFMGRQQALQEALDALAIGIDAKVDGIGKVMSNFIATADRCKEEAQRLRNRADGFERKAQHLKDYLRRCLAAMGDDTQRVAGELFSVTLAKASEPEPHVVSDDLLPDQFKIAVLEMPLPSVPPAMRDSIKSQKVDTKAAKAAAETTGKLLPGMEWKVRERSLRGLPGGKAR